MKRTLLFGTVHSASETLERAGVPRPRWTAEQLLSHRLGCAPIDLYLEESTPSVIARSDSDEAISFQADVAARAGGVPLQYLLGAAEFYGREFFVGPGVFIPRPETEVLVEVALEVIYHDPVVVDVGTGCGAIAITLALECPGLRMIATDRSRPTLSFARRNAGRHHLPVTFLQGDLLDSFTSHSVDLIVANLPYLDPKQASSWPPELAWEPRRALDGGEEGLSLIRRLLEQGSLILRAGGQLLLEIGGGQGQAVRRFAETQGFQFDRLVPDLAGMERVAVLWKD